MATYAIDYETYYDEDVSVKKMSYPQYAKATDIYLVGIVGDDGFRWSGHPKYFGWDTFEDDDEFVSHNAAFDRAMYEQTMQLYGFKFFPRAWHCTANLMAFMRISGYRSLEEACKLLLNVEIDKSTRSNAAGIKYEDMLHRPAKKKGFTNFYEEMCAYNLDDNDYCLQIWQQYGGEWPQFERELSDWTIRSSLNGLPIDRAKCERYVKELGLAIFEATARIPWTSKPKAKVTSYKEFCLACKELGVEPPGSIAEDDNDYLKWEQTHGEEISWVRDMRIVRKSNLVLKRIEMFLERADENDRFSYSSKYFGAHTGRWSSDRGFNPGNMPKEKLQIVVKGKELEIDFRSCVRAAKGKKLIIIDLSQIEARITPYLAGDEKTMQMIRDGISVYEAHARLTMGYNDEGVLKKVDKVKYEFAKMRVLSLGFGCGAARFKESARVIYGVEMTLDKAKFEVKDFRAKNPKIVKLWKTLDEAFRGSVGGNYELELPSGRVLTFFDVNKGSPGKFGPEYLARVTMNGQFKKMYGGLLTENLVQATARDIFGHGMLNIEKAGHESLFSVHDECVVQVDKSVSPKEIEMLICQSPDWCLDLPIGAEAVESDFYLK